MLLSTALWNFLPSPFCCLLYHVMASWISKRASGSILTLKADNTDWTAVNTCAGYSCKAWEAATGENLNSTNVFGLTTPTVLSQSIYEANGDKSSNTATYDVPSDISSKQSSAKSSASNSSSGSGSNTGSSTSSNSSSGSSYGESSSGGSVIESSAGGGNMENE